MDTTDAFAFHEKRNEAADVGDRGDAPAIIGILVGLKEDRDAVMGGGRIPFATITDGPSKTLADGPADAVIAAFPDVCLSDDDWGF